MSVPNNRLRALCAWMALLTAFCVTSLAATGGPLTGIPRSPPYIAGGIGADELEGTTQVRRIDLRERLRTEYVRWPSNPETDFPGSKATEKEE